MAAAAVTTGEQPLTYGLNTANISAPYGGNAAASTTGTSNELSSTTSKWTGVAATADKSTQARRAIYTNLEEDYDDDNDDDNGRGSSGSSKRGRGRTRVSDRSISRSPSVHSDHRDDSRSRSGSPRSEGRDRDSPDRSRGRSKLRHSQSRSRSRSGSRPHSAAGGDKDSETAREVIDEIDPEELEFQKQRTDQRVEDHRLNLEQERQNMLQKEREDMAALLEAKHARIVDSTKAVILSANEARSGPYQATNDMHGNGMVALYHNVKSRPGYQHLHLFTSIPISRWDAGIRTKIKEGGIRDQSVIATLGNHTQIVAEGSAVGDNEVLLNSLEADVHLIAAKLVSASGISESMTAYLVSSQHSRTPTGALHLNGQFTIPNERAIAYGSREEKVFYVDSVTSAPIDRTDDNDDAAGNGNDLRTLYAQRVATMVKYIKVMALLEKQDRLEASARMVFPDEERTDEPYLRIHRTMGTFDHSKHFEDLMGLYRQLMCGEATELEWETICDERELSKKGYVLVTRRHWEEFERYLLQKKNDLEIRIGKDRVELESVSRSVVRNSHGAAIGSLSSLLELAVIPTRSANLWNSKDVPLDAIGKMWSKEMGGPPTETIEIEWEAIVAPSVEDFRRRRADLLPVLAGDNDDDDVDDNVDE